jgi:hypothetical protein
VFFCAIRPQVRSEYQLGRVVVTDLDVVEGGLGLVIFDKIVLDAGFVGLGENMLPVDVALANVGHVSELAVWTGGALVVVSVHVLGGPVLHVNQGKRPGYAAKYFSGSWLPTVIQQRSSSIFTSFGSVLASRKS